MNQVDDKTKKEGIQGGLQEPRIPIHIPLSILRWLAYTVCFGLILAPGFWLINARGVIGAAFILGHFASQLNALINKK